ncbi:hypothetical protein LTR64_000502 [Lithohypha guttulata]|uniref:uncharacterized protein n=1 Tax=Lithohypha guttulata TaxID=1690604 RepID=UPI00315CED2D
MAPSITDNHPDLSDRPLADYFWIAGLDSQDLLDAYQTHVDKRDSVSTPEHRLSRTLNETIREDAAAEENAESILCTPSVSTKHSRRNSYQKLSTLSSEARFSIQSLDRLTCLSSTRSNATIRRVVSPSAQSSLPTSPGLLQPISQPESQRQSALLSDAEFEQVMTRFNSDRDAFYLDLNFKSEAVNPKPSRSIQQPRPRTQRIVAEELDAASAPSRTLGSVRRHVSFKDMNSARRQPSIARKLSTRSAMRVSSYNSVMPMPQPLQPSPDEHPLKHSFEPVLLDVYPPSKMAHELNRRDRFPDYVPMFAFPNDIHIISSDARPATKWHEFSMTAADNTKRPAVCIIVWVPLDTRVADALEKRCEEWRRAHMSEAERELASSLGERLAAERAKLSRLLAQLPYIESGSEERESLEDQIGVVEEKISLMSDMLKPLRYGAANRIEGLTDSDTGLWAPRAYGLLGRDQGTAPFWKEWLRAVVVPMLDGAVLGVPPSSPKVGMWQPLERYVEILCTKAFQPITSRIQVEVAIRELRLYAKKEAKNELPGSRTIDLYPLFRCLTIPNIVVLFEYLLAESRIILVSAYTSLLKLVSNALLSLMWPFEWSGVYIPVLPTRLMEVLEAPIPYVCGVVRKNDNLSLPQDDDFILVDLDKNELHATARPPVFPSKQKRKLISSLYHVAPHHQTRGVAVGPPAYAYEAFPNDQFVSEHPTIFSTITPSVDLGRLASLSSNQFGSSATSSNNRTPLCSVFAQASPLNAYGSVRVGTSSTARQPSHAEDSDWVSPMTGTFSKPNTPQSRNDSGFALQVSLKEKRSRHFDTSSRYDRPTSNIRRKSSLPFMKHNSTISQASDIPTFNNTSTYAPSTYAQSTLAASTVMPGMPYQQKKLGLREMFNVDAWIRSLPPDHANYMMVMKETQAFDGFVHEREIKSQSACDSIALFDALMAARKGRSKGVRNSIVLSLSGRNPFAGRSPSGGVPAEYLSDTSTHIWRVISTPHTSERADSNTGQARGRIILAFATSSATSNLGEEEPTPADEWS